MKDLFVEIGECFLKIVSLSTVEFLVALFFQRYRGSLDFFVNEICCDSFSNILIQIVFRASMRKRLFGHTKIGARTNES